mmetsp:Transcript_35530/g.26416  ORF Transcript_35530/g.26416 Transcript_35530/m.26416 type:complete len:88 (+) Transcript_35530:1-264(+)
MRLRQLNLTSNPIKVEGFAKVLLALSKSPKLEGIHHLFLSDLDIDKILPSKLGESVLKMSELQKLNFSLDGIKVGSGPFFQRIIAGH